MATRTILKSEPLGVQMSAGHVNVVKEDCNFVFNFENPVSRSRFSTEFETGWEDDLQAANLGVDVNRLIVRLSAMDEGVLRVNLAPRALILKTNDAFDLEVAERHIAMTVGADSFTPAVRGKMAVH